jgi:hypothetical protein
MIALLIIIRYLAPTFSNFKHIPMDLAALRKHFGCPVNNNGIPIRKCPICTGVPGPPHTEADHCTNPRCRRLCKDNHTCSYKKRHNNAPCGGKDCAISDHCAFQVSQRATCGALDHCQHRKKKDA